MNRTKTGNEFHFLGWVRNLLFYGGLTREEFRSVQPNITKKNQDTLLLGSAMVALLFLGLSIGSMISERMAEAKSYYIGMLVVSIAIFALAKTISPRRPKWVLPLWYALFLAFSGYSIMLNTVLRPALSATTICVFLVAGPLLIIDRPLRVMALTLSNAVVFAICAVQTKTSYMAFADSVNLVCCVFLGAAIYMRINRVKLREVLQTKQLQHDRDTDRLTLLLNKSAFLEQAQAMLSHKTTGVLLVMDVDDFKNINDSYGHDFGDVVLQRTAACLRRMCSAADLCARFGGDEFMVFIPGISKNALIEWLEQLMERIKQDVLLPDPERTMGISIGAAFYPKDGQNYEELFRSADNALYAAKKLGKNRYLFFGD